MACALAAAMTVQLVACSNSGEKDKGDTTPTPTVTEQKDNPNEGNGNGGEPGERVKVTYGGWINKFDAVVLEELFEKAYPEVDLVILDQWMNNEELTKLAAANELPDVINFDNLPLALQNDWLIDMKPMFDADPDHEMAYENLIDYGSLNGKLYGLTSTVFFKGLNVNLDLIESLNMPKPTYNWTVDEAVAILKKATIKGESLGSLSIHWVAGIMPAFMGREEINWACVNRETGRFELGDEWLKAVTLYKELYDAGTSLWEQTDRVGRPWEFEPDSPEAISAEQARTDYIMETLGTIEDGWAAGKTSMQDFETWLIGWDEHNPRGDEHQYANFEFDSYPLPSHDGSTRIPLYTDFLGITTACENTEAAYKFVKFCTYMEKAYLDRIDYAINFDREAFAVAHPDVPQDQYPEKDYILYKWAPAVNTDAARDAFKRLHGEVYENGKPGILFMVDHIAEGFADPIRFMPGYLQAWDLNFNTITQEIINGNKAPADIQKDLETNMNKIVDDAYAALGL